MRTRTSLALLVLVAAALASTSCVRAPAPRAAASSRVAWSGSFTEGFDGEWSVDEARSPDRSSSTAWWLGSGASLVSKNGLGSTLIGESPSGYFRTRYAERNPVDTDDGRHPQNLFRLVSQQEWGGDILQQNYFRILEYRLSDSPQRYAPNGLLLFTRYADENTLYYAGIRVDGHAVVKKKVDGVYYTLSEKPVFPGTYDRETEPFLLPKDKWIGLRSLTKDNDDGSVTVSLYMDEGRSGEWKLLLRGIDAGVGGQPLRQGRTGIRTDFMDVQFDDYSVSTAE